MADPSSAPATEDEAVTSEMTQPIIVDLGRQRSSKLKDLKEGEGELWEEALDVIQEIKDMLGKEAEGKVIMPVIMLYEKKTREQRLERILFPLVDWDNETDDGDDNEEGDND